jgi:hypothetical protein
MENISGTNVITQLTMTHRGTKSRATNESSHVTKNGVRLVPRPIGNKKFVYIQWSVSTENQVRMFFHRRFAIYAVKNGVQQAREIRVDRSCDCISKKLSEEEETVRIVYRFENAITTPRNGICAINHWRFQVQVQVLFLTPKWRH